MPFLKCWSEYQPVQHIICPLADDDCRGFIPFVRDEEPGVLTYGCFSRPKAANELLLFVRYKDSKAMNSHSKAPEHVAVVKEIMKIIENDMSKSTTVWQEVEDSFVSTVEGGGTGSSKL